MNIYVCKTIDLLKNVNYKKYFGCCRASSAKSSIESAGLVGTAEKSFLTPKHSTESHANIPSLDEFDSEIDIYRVSTMFMR